MNSSRLALFLGAMAILLGAISLVAGFARGEGLRAGALVPIVFGLLAILFARQGSGR